MAKGWTVVRMIMIFLFYASSPPKGETTHYILLVASAPSTFVVTDSLNFQVAGAPLQIQFASAKCVRCAPLRSGGRRLAVRTAMDHPIGALPRTPFPASRDFPSRGNEKIGGTGYCVTYDTESQSRNADFISIARRAIHNPRGQRPRQT